MQIKPPVLLKNFNLFIDDIGYAGQAEEVTLPVLKLKTEAFQEGGMDIPVELDMGMEAMQCHIVLSDYNEAVLNTFGLLDSAFLLVPTALSEGKVALKLKGALVRNGTTAKVVVECRGIWLEADMGLWRAGEKQTMNLTLGVRYYKFSVDDQAQIEIDAVNMSRSINGDSQTLSVF
jgi:P2 family phage contractile tail tube protein